MTSWNDEQVDRLETIDAEVHAFHDEPDRRGRLARDHPPDGPLRGLAVGVKDLFRVDGLATTGGSALPPELFDGPESWIVSVLRAAGATVLGKTAMDELGYCEPAPTRNPLDLTRSPGGSSSGSAAAVGAGICPLALGSQTLQSTMVPAAFCGVVGYKPTFDRWPFDGVHLAPSIDTIGFLATDVATTARAATLLPGWTPSTVDRPVLGVPDVWGVRRLHTAAWTAFGRQAKALRAAGFELRHATVPWNDDTVASGAAVGDLVRAELAEVHRPWFDDHRHLYRPRTAEAVERGRAIDVERVAECRQRVASLAPDLATVTEANGIDCWICPSAGSVAVPYGEDADSWMTCFWSVAGWPSVSVPVFDGPDGLPHGLQLIAPHGRDEDLLAWAALVSDAMTAWPPTRDGA
jgi:Asp-tRNA(Asn)/Glu-tRNA(Gln) amidotransferase A subunit family amidase